MAKKLSQLVKMEKNLMRTMELVGKERMEVAVCQLSIIVSIGALIESSNNSRSGVKHVMTTFLMSRISSVF